MESAGESRAHPRAEAYIKAEYHHGTTTGVGRTSNISEGGIYLQCDHPAAPGTRVFLRLHLPGSEDPLKLVGICTRATPRVQDPDSAPGMAIAFEVAYARTKRQLHGFMAMIIGGASEEGVVERLDDDGAGAAYVARFPEIAGQPRARTIPPRELEAAFSFTPGPQEAKPAAPAEEDSKAVRGALVIVALVIALVILLQALRGG